MSTFGCFFGCFGRRNSTIVPEPSSTSSPREMGWVVDRPSHTNSNKAHDQGHAAFKTAPTITIRPSGSLSKKQLIAVNAESPVAPIAITATSATAAAGFPTSQRLESTISDVSTMPSTLLGGPHPGAQPPPSLNLQVQHSAARTPTAAVPATPPLQTPPAQTIISTPAQQLLQPVVFTPPPRSTHWLPPLLAPKHAPLQTPAGHLPPLQPLRVDHTFGRPEAPVFEPPSRQSSGHLSRMSLASSFHPTLALSGGGFGAGAGAAVFDPNNASRDWGSASVTAMTPLRHDDSPMTGVRGPAKGHGREREPAHMEFERMNDRRKRRKVRRANATNKALPPARSGALPSLLLKPARRLDDVEETLTCPSPSEPSTPAAAPQHGAGERYGGSASGAEASFTHQGGGVGVEEDEMRRVGRVQDAMARLEAMMKR